MSTTISSVDLKHLGNQPPSTSLPQSTAEAPNGATTCAEPIASGHERDGAGQRAEREAAPPDFGQRLDTMSRKSRRLRRALYARDPRVQELAPGVARLKAAVAEIEADAENYSAAEYLDAEANLEEARLKLRIAKDRVEVVNRDKINEAKLERRKGSLLTTDEVEHFYAEEKALMRKEAERTAKERRTELDRDFWKSEAERYMAGTVALEIRLQEMEI